MSCDVPEEVLEAPHRMLQVESQVPHRMSAGSLTCGTTAGEGGFRRPCARFQVVTLEEGYRKKWDLFKRCHGFNLGAEMTNIVAIDRIVLYLKMKEL